MKVVLFDGVCNLCNGFLQIIIKNDKSNTFHFASLQSDAAAKLLTEKGVKQTNIGSIILIKNQRVLFKSDAVLEITKDFGYQWKVFQIFWLIPKQIRDWVYDLIAKNRYKLLGMKEECWLPTPELRSKFLDHSI